LLVACRPEVEAATYRAGGAHDGFNRLDRVICPVLLTVGAQSPPWAMDLARSQSGVLGQARVEVVEGGGHFGPLQAPKAMAEAIGRFLRSL